MPGNSMNNLAQTYNLLNQLRGVTSMPPAQSSQAPTQFYTHGFPLQSLQTQQQQQLQQLSAPGSVNPAAAGGLGGVGGVGGVGSNDAASAVLSQLLSLIDTNGLSQNGQAALINFLAMQNRDGAAAAVATGAGPSHPLAPPPPSLPFSLQAALNASGVQPQNMAVPVSVAAYSGANAYPTPSHNGALFSTVLHQQQQQRQQPASPVQQFQESIQLQVKRMRYSSSSATGHPDPATSATVAAAASSNHKQPLLTSSTGFPVLNAGAMTRSLPPSVSSSSVSTLNSNSSDKTTSSAPAPRLFPHPSTSSASTSQKTASTNAWKPSDRHSPCAGGGSLARLSNNPAKDTSGAGTAALLPGSRVAPKSRLSLVSGGSAAEIGATAAPCYGAIVENLYDPAQPTPVEDLEMTAIIQQHQAAPQQQLQRQPQNGFIAATPSMISSTASQIALTQQQQHQLQQAVPGGVRVHGAIGRIGANGVPTAMTGEDIHRLAAQQEAARMENILMQLRSPGIFAVTSQPSNEQLKPEDPAKKKEYCTVCSCYLDQPLLLHRRSKEHKKKKEHMYPRCRKCNIRNFENRTAYEDHCKSEDHRRACEAWALRRQQLQGGGPEESLSGVGRQEDEDNDAASPLDDSGNGVEADAVLRPSGAAGCATVVTEAMEEGAVQGVFKGVVFQDLKSAAAPPNAWKLPSQKPTNQNAHYHNNNNKNNFNNNNDDVLASTDAGVSTLQFASSPSVPSFAEHSAMLSASAFDASAASKTSFKAFEDAASGATPSGSMGSSKAASGSSEKPVGQEFVIPTTGFFCKLCNKFYHEENQAKVHHCMTPDHLSRYQDLLSALSNSLSNNDVSPDNENGREVTEGGGKSGGSDGESGAFGSGCGVSVGSGSGGGGASGFCSGAGFGAGSVAAGSKRKAAPPPIISASPKDEEHQTPASDGVDTAFSSSSGGGGGAVGGVGGVDGSGNNATTADGEDELEHSKE